MTEVPRARAIIALLTAAALAVPQVGLAGKVIVDEGEGGGIDLPEEMEDDEIVDPGVVPESIVEGESDGGQAGTIQRRAQVVSAAATQDITAALQEAYLICSSLEDGSYAPDCVRDRIETLAASLPSTGDYAPVKEVLEQAAQKLDGVVRRNRAPAKPRASVRTVVRGTPVQTAPLRPVRAEAVETALESTVAILDEAQTQLLRSSANSDRRQVHYQNIATAIGSNKILLRSA